MAKKADRSEACVNSPSAPNEPDRFRYRTDAGRAKKRRVVASILILDRLSMPISHN